MTSSPCDELVTIYHERCACFRAKSDSAIHTSSPSSPLPQNYPPSVNSSPSPTSAGNYCHVASFQRHAWTMVHIVAQCANRYVVIFHVAILYCYLLWSSYSWLSTSMPAPCNPIVPAGMSIYHHGYLSAILTVLHVPLVGH